METLQRRSRPADRGFTLIELLIVVVILGILSGIVVFAVTSFTTSGAKAACKADYKTVQTAVDAFKAQEGAYPNSSVGWIGGYSSYDGVQALLHQDTTVNPALGPWLHDQPTNGHHYRIELNETTSPGTVQLYKWNDTSGAAANQLPSPGTGSIADCNSVK
jgi:prepilin-type N-terminal cleavage/methylation domain-containing protein